ncbi:hypothetical protein D1007_23441 [Hordeum vulgare]|uniref:Predicted protein n=1 Tax=Hordeum vulgare subsp. vulgare TaxID=112509 RepID=F2E0V3_HORVV|nr:uncharacterized protein LOC123420586 [Hordeum vulgare subsp. vulgare]KAE8800943.1 hypothetical protein D1007_23441 [Hordeum vulgare]BAK00975.1 predicted protein [Hordeum vulgare subsp. vulgare]
MEERVVIPRRREPQDQDQAVDVDDAAGAAAAPAVSCSSGEESTDGEFEFEFPSLLGIGRDHGSPAPADDLFADGRIRPVAFYPVFGRRPSSSAGDVGLAPAPAPAPERRTRGQLGRLFLEESRAWNSSSSSSTGSTASSSSAATTEDGDGDGGLEGAAPESYCVWAPGGGKPSESPRAGKSRSTGSSVARWRRISNLVVGRSQSDGKEKFLFLPVNPHPPPKPKQQEHEPRPRARPPTTNLDAGGTKKKGSEIGTVAAAHRMAYGGGNGATPRRTFLPYREELVGFFANVNGISRGHAHPY